VRKAGGGILSTGEKYKGCGVHGRYGRATLQNGDQANAGDRTQTFSVFLILVGW
jgi:hypothetical protein